MTHTTITIFCWLCDFIWIMANAFLKWHRRKKRTVTHYKWWTYDLNQKQRTQTDTYQEKRFKKRKYTANNKNVDCHRLSGYIQRYFCVECKGNDPSRYAYTKKSKCHFAAWTLGTKMLKTIDVSRNNINKKKWDTHIPFNAHSKQN